MKVYSAYPIKIKNLNTVFDETTVIFRDAVDWYIAVLLIEWDNISSIGNRNRMVQAIEKLTIETKKNPCPRYNFTVAFYKFPCYLRRSAIAEAIGKVSSYKSNLEKNPKTGPPKAGNVYPVMYRDNMFVRTGTYTASLKAYIHNTWDWVDVELNKSDVDYILHHCSNRKECVPTLRKKGKRWVLTFAFEEKIKLKDVPIQKQRILAVDLGYNNACTCSVMESNGTILARRFLKLGREQDFLVHELNKIKKAQQHGAKHMPRLWALADGTNDDIAVKTAGFIIKLADEFHVDTIVMEHLNFSGKICGSKKQRLHLWKTRYIEHMVEDKAHRMGIHFSTVCAWNTSKLAFDGSGNVERNIDNNYSICQFKTGKIYNCDLNASYNIGARYFIRELTKSLPATAKLDIEAKVPQCSKRSTCTLSTLLSLYPLLPEELHSA